MSWLGLLIAVWLLWMSVRAYLAYRKFWRASEIEVDRQMEEIVLILEDEDLAELDP